MRAGAGDRAAGKLKRHAGGTHHVRPAVHLRAKRMKGAGTEDEQQTGIKEISARGAEVCGVAHTLSVCGLISYDLLNGQTTRSSHAFLPGGFQWFQQDFNRDDHTQSHKITPARAAWR